MDQLKIDPKDVAARLAELRTSFQASGQPGSFDERAARVMAKRMRDRPDLYVEFGPYWWSVKAALREAGHAVGDYTDAMVQADYAMPSATESLVAAELFKDSYRVMYPRGANSFMLEEDGEPYLLEDPDMMARAPGVSGLNPAG
jgi:hypothetical protein